MCPLVNVDQGQYIHHRVHRDVQSKEVESGGTVVRRCDEVGTDMSCWRTYIPSTWSTVWVFSPSRMAEKMASLHESAVRMMAPFFVKMATLSLAPVAPLELSVH